MTQVAAEQASKRQEMVACPECGQSNPLTSLFCYRCGAKLAPQAEAASEAQRSLARTSDVEVSTKGTALEGTALEGTALQERAEGQRFREAPLAETSKDGPGSVTGALPSLDAARPGEVLGVALESSAVLGAPKPAPAAANATVPAAAPATEGEASPKDEANPSANQGTGAKAEREFRNGRIAAKMGIAFLAVFFALPVYIVDSWYTDFGPMFSFGTAGILPIFYAGNAASVSGDLFAGASGYYFGLSLTLVVIITLLVLLTIYRSRKTGRASFWCLPAYATALYYCYQLITNWGLQQPWVSPLIYVIVVMAIVCMVIPLLARGAWL